MEQFSNFTFVKQISLEVLGSKFIEEMELPSDVVVDLKEGDCIKHQVQVVFPSSTQF